MRQSAEIFESALTAAATDECSQRIRRYILSQKLSEKDAARYALTAEEILLDSEDCEDFRLTVGKRLFRPRVMLEVFGKQLNAFHKNTSGSLLGDSILKNLGLSPEYYYQNETNTYVFRIKKRTLNPIVTLIVVLACALLLGFAGKMFFPDALRNGILTYALTPLHDVFMNMLDCIAGPMIFLSVAWGIYGIGDAATLKRAGKKLLTGYVTVVLVAGVFAILLGLFCFSLRFASESSGSSELESILHMLLGIIPTNIFSPFTEGNTLQIIFLAITIGISMLILGQKTAAVAKALDGINLIIQFLIEFISKLVPVFIFTVVTDLIWSDSISSMASVGKYFAVGIGGIVLYALFVSLITGIRMKVNPLLLVKKGLPTFLIALSTASSAAAFGTNMNTSVHSYGINRGIASFGLPLGMVAHKPSTTINYTLAALFFAYFYHIEISVSWLVMLLFSASVLAIATPPIPGGAMTAYTVLFTQLGIPPEAVAIALACDAIFDFTDTGFDQFLLPLSILPQANKLGLTDRKTLISSDTVKKSE